MRANPEGLRKFSLFHILIIAAFAIGLYSNTLKNSFVYDDGDTIVNNTLIKSFDNLPLLFDKAAYFSRSGELSYRPFVTLTYFADYAIYGLGPLGYHLTNVLLHALNGISLYIFLTLLIRPPTNGGQQPIISAPFIISILFVANPILTEVVNLISYREDLLVFFFYITTLTLYLSFRGMDTDNRQRRVKTLYLLSCLTYTLALFTKEMAATLPLILLCYDWIFADKNKKGHPAFILNKYNIGYIIITIAYLYIRFYYAYNRFEGRLHFWPLSERVLTMPSLILYDLKLSVIPHVLSADYAISPVKSFFSPMFIMPSLLLIIAGMAIRKAEWRILFGTLFFTLSLMPVLNIVPIANPLAERYLYLPSTGVTMVLGLLIHKLAQSHVNSIQKYTVVFVMYFIVLTLHSTALLRRNAVWKDDYSLWLDTTRKTPSAHSIFNLGVVYDKKGRIDEAAQVYQTALRLNPDFPLYLKIGLNLAIDYDKQEKQGAAELELKNVLRAQPDYYKAHYYLGTIYHKQGRIDDAVQELITALNIKPDFWEAHHELGLVYSKQGHLDEAIRHLQTALTLKPDNYNIHGSIGIAYFKQGKFEDALQQFKTAVSINPSDTKSHNNIGIIYSEQGRLEEAIEEFKTALKFDPSYAEAHYNLGIVYFKKGLKDAANKEFMTTLKLKPDHLETAKILNIH